VGWEETDKASITEAKGVNGMDRRTSLIAASVFLGAVATTVVATRAADQPQQRPVPQSEAFEHEEVIGKLTRLAQKPAPVGPAAQKALELIKPHLDHDKEVALPPLTLLPLLAEGKVTPDMKWALPLIDQVKAEQPQNTKEHEAITAALTALFNAGEDANDPEASGIARECTGDLLNDDEVGEPTVLLIGEYLRAKLGTNQ
jgi:hypothetical protein